MSIHHVYFKLKNVSSLIYLLLYVDDMLISYNEKSEIDFLKSKLCLEFEVKDLGSVKIILDMDIVRIFDSLFLPR